MRIAVVGTGNVGSALLIHLMEVPYIDEVLVMNLEDEWSKAAIMDAAGAYPQEALKLIVAPFSRIVECDVIVLSSGAQLKEGDTPKDVLEKNMEVMDAILDGKKLKSSAIIIATATPVDDITAYIQYKTGLPSNQVMGFGGDVDKNRLLYTLKKNGVTTVGVEVTGEHMKRTVPVYEGEEKYNEIAETVQSFLSNITSQGGSPRNLATGFLLSRLINSIVSDSQQKHYVCSFLPDYGIYLTWPFHVGKDGAGSPFSVAFGAKSKEAFESLVSLKREELREILT